MLDGFQVVSNGEGRSFEFAEGFGEIVVRLLGEYYLGGCGCGGHFEGCVCFSAKDGERLDKAELLQAGWMVGVLCGFHQLHVCSVCSVCSAAEFESLTSSSKQRVLSSYELNSTPSSNLSYEWRRKG